MFHPSADFLVTCDGSGKAVVSGVMRLSSPTAYEEAFLPIKNDLENHKGEYSIDLSKLQYLNSSGITSLARIVLIAKKRNDSIFIHGDPQIPWQEKTLSTLARLYSKCFVRLSSAQPSETN
jgi:hypothetical protein